MFNSIGALEILGSRADYCENDLVDATQHRSAALKFVHLSEGFAVPG